jgi:zinc protease
MRSIRNIAIVIAGVLPSMSAYPQAKDYRDIKTPPLHAQKVVQPKRIQLANGMVIFLMEDHELPLISGTARIRGGSRDVGADKAGLAGIYGGSWRTGGTEKQTGDQLDEFLEARAARVETGVGDDSSRVGFNILKGDFDAVFPIFVDVLEHPAFRQEKIDLAKTQANTGISRRNDDAQGIAGREAFKLGYGADSSYARSSEYATIASITRDDLLAFHKRFVHPNNIILGVAGDFDSATMEKRLRAAFESWPKGPAASKTAPTDIHPAKPGVYAIHKDDITQAYLYVVGPGTTRNTPDYYALGVMNEVFGGGFSGRLVNDIRTARGLAYNVGGGLGYDWDHPALFRVVAGTKSSTAIEALNAIRGEINDLTTKPFTAAEVDDAKQAMLNAFVFTRDEKSKLIGQRIDLEFYGYPADWYDRYVAGIEKVTPADVERVAKKYVNPSQVAILVVGNEKDFDKPLSTVGTVTPIDITIPEPGAKPAAPPAPGSKPGAAASPATSGNAAGVTLAKKVAEFLGGKAKVDAVQAIHSVGSMTVKTPNGDMEIGLDNIVRFPDSRHSVMKTPMGEMTMVSTPEGAFAISPMGSQDLPSSQRDSAKAEMKTDALAVVHNIDKPGYTFTMTGTEKVDNVDAQTLEINADGATVTWWVDPATGRILRRTQKGRSGEQVLTTLSDWKPFGGLNFATSFTSTTNGEQVASGKLTSVEVNPAIDPKLFEKPAAK